MSISAASISSIDSMSAQDTFDGLYDLFERLKKETMTLRDTMKQYTKNYMDVDLSEQLFEPKPHAKEWFIKRDLKTPCDLETFLRKLFEEMGAQRRVDQKTRSLILNQEEAALFMLQPNYAYRWIEVLSKIPNIFQ